MITRTNEGLKKECKKMCAARALTFDMPVKIDGRLSVTVAKFKDGELHISRKLTDYGSEETLTAVLLHQCAFYCSLLEKDGPKGKDMVAALCATPEYAKYVDGVVPDSPKVWKFNVRCPQCGRYQGETKRTKLVINAKEYICGGCGHKGLEVIENW